MSTPIFARRLDLVYLIFFLTHIPIMFLVDLYPIYPTSLVPAFLTSIRQWYITNYRDRFFIQPPAWFRFYIWTEALYHIPLSSWAVRALWNDHPLIPLHLLIWSIQTATTTATCIVDYLSWNGYSTQEKAALGSLYVPYFVLSVLMGVDMFRRLELRLENKAQAARKLD